MSDVDEHFRRVRTVARHMAEQEWLKERYAMLERQRAVLQALNIARESLWDSDEKELLALSKLQTHAARVCIATCEAIMRHSGLAGLDKSDWGDQDEGGESAAREESLPW